MNNVFILDYKRTPYCSYLGKLKSYSAVKLGEICSKELLKYNNINNSDIDIVYYGNVLAAGLGQNIARQISYNIGINAPSITVNRVCSSGMEAIRQGYNSIKLGDVNCILVGGCESMSNTPYLNFKIKDGNKMGNIEIIDSMINDGLIDPFSNKHMGLICEELCDEYNITREELDKYTINSYLNSRNALKNNFFKEIVSIEDINIDEEIFKVEDLEKIYKLKSVFKKNGKLTAGNSSKLSDGAASLLLVSKEFLDNNNLKPKAVIKSFDISVKDPKYFPLAPLESIIKLLKKNKLKISDIDYFEINEAFSLLPILLHKQYNIEYNKINIYGGAISMGHPLGSSGCRIVGNLLNILNNNNSKLGCATICNGGGGATSVLIENII
jgi:acetyl-CoA C-acetyltransferase